MFYPTEAEFADQKAAARAERLKSFRVTDQDRDRVARVLDAHPEWCDPDNWDHVIEAHAELDLSGHKPVGGTSAVEVVMTERAGRH